MSKGWGKYCRSLFRDVNKEENMIDYHIKYHIEEDNIVCPFCNKSLSDLSCSHFMYRLNLVDFIPSYQIDSTLDDINNSYDRLDKNKTFQTH